MTKPKAGKNTTPRDVDHHPWDRCDGETSAGREVLDPERIAHELRKIAEPAPDIAGLIPAESKATARRAVAQLKSLEQRWDGN